MSSRITSTNPGDIICNQLNQLNCDVCQLKSFTCTLEGQINTLESLEDVIPSAVLTEEQPSNTTSASVTGNTSWLQRALNNIVSDSGIGVTISANQFTLPPGTYSFDISAPAYNANGHKIRLHNITSGTIVAYGTSEFSSNNVQTRSVLHFTEQIIVDSTYTVYHYLNTGGSTNNRGRPLGIANVPEVYLQIKIQRIAS